MRAPDSFAQRFVPHNESLVLTIGRLEDRKGLDVLIRAFAAVDRSQWPSKLVIAGSGDATKYSVLADSLGLSGAVLFPGWVSEEDRASLLEACDIFVSSSRHEGFGLAAFEAMASGKPIVMTGTALVKDGVVTADRGAVAEVDDPASLTAAIVGLLENPSRARAIGQGNQDWVRRNFSWQAAAKSTIAALRACLWEES